MINKSYNYIYYIWFIYIYDKVDCTTNDTYKSIMISFIIFIYSLIYLKIFKLSNNER